MSGRPPIRRSWSLVAAVLALSATLTPTGLTAPATPARAPGLIAFQVGQQIWTMRPDGAGVGTFLVEGTRPAWSPDGDELAFDVVHDGRTVVAVIRPDGTGERVLARGREPAWSPDGSRLAFVRLVGGAPTVFVIRADGHRVTEIGEGSVPTWSADGSRLAFLRDLDVWTTAVDGTDQVQISATAPSGAELGSVLDVAWSPDGNQIAYVADGGIPETTGFFLISPSGSDEIQVQGPPWYAYPQPGIAWSPDSSQLVFRSMTPDVCVDFDRAFAVGRDGENVVPLGTSGSGIGVSDLSFSPDGSRVLGVVQIEDSTGPECEYSAHIELAVTQPLDVPGPGPSWRTLGKIDYGAAPVWQPIPCAITGTEGDDVLTGTAGDDVICGLGGEDTLVGSGGDDTFVGGPGTDALDLSGAPEAVTVDLRALTAVGDGRDLVVGIEDVTGSSFADSLAGDDGPNMLSGGGASDALSGWSGPDTLLGGPGDDMVVLGACEEAEPCTADGGEGVDTARMERVSSLDLAAGTAWGGSGTTWMVTAVEWVEGSGADDVIAGTSDRNVVWARGGSDDVSGLAGDDLLVGGAGDDRLGGGRGDDTCLGGPGEDALRSCERR